jgi:hypothetical protein
MRNLKHLQVLTVELEGESLEARPMKFGQTFDPEAWKVRNIEVTATLDDMKLNKSKPSKMKCWVLRKAIKGVASSQNADRDFLAIAQAGAVEERIVARYRARLLRQSDTAMWLRTEIERLACKSLKKKTKKTEYGFPDGICLSEELDSEPDVELSTIVEVTKLERQYREEKKEVAGLLTRIRNAGVSQATPWTKMSTREMADKVDEFEQVSDDMNCVEAVFMRYCRC